MAVMSKSQKKAEYFRKLADLTQTYSKILVVKVDHVGSKQMANIRHALRGKAIILMGKNTTIKTALKQVAVDMPQLERLIGCVRQNIGFVFCIADMSVIQKTLEENRLPAPARQGVIAPCDVWVRAGPTSIHPTQTSFFQALGISTKIVRQIVEIQTDMHLLKVGDKVTASQSVLLQKLEIFPFAFGVEIVQVYDDGSVYGPEVLSIADEDIMAQCRTGIRNIAAFSRQIGLPTTASVPHMVIEAFKNCTSLVLSSDFTFPEMENIKKMVENPQMFAAAAPAPAAAAASADKGKAKVEEEEEEEEGDMGFSLFD